MTGKLSTPRRRARCIRLLATTLTAGLIGCVPPTPPPHVQLADLRGSLGNFGAKEVAASLVIGNSEPSELHIARAEYRISLGGAYLGTGKTEGELLIPARDDAPETVTLAIENSAALPYLRQAITGKTVRYRVEGTIEKSNGEKVMLAAEGILQAIE